MEFLCALGAGSDEFRGCVVSTSRQVEKLDEVQEIYTGASLTRFAQRVNGRVKKVRGRKEKGREGKGREGKGGEGNGGGPDSQLLK